MSIGVGWNSSVKNIPKRNMICILCNKEMKGSVICGKHGKTICLNHCRQCEYFVPWNWHCKYRSMNEEKTQIERRINDFKKKHSI
jgi:hypothetical protein